MARSCSFCDRQATTTVADDNDVFPCCGRCASDWAENPGFTSWLDQALARNALRADQLPPAIRDGKFSSESDPENPHAH